MSKNDPNGYVECTKKLPVVERKHCSQYEKKEPLTFPNFAVQDQEHKAWRQVCLQYTALTGNSVNTTPTEGLIHAIRLWGEELHQLRLTCPEHDHKALQDAREGYKPYQIKS
jgi:spore cortex formation protein SpoVR/YcgB (stage V sporulation)